MQSKNAKSNSSKNASSIGGTEVPADFSKKFFAKLLPDDLAALSPDERYGIASSLWNLAKNRKPNEVSLRIFNPSEESDGWSVDHTVLEIVSDDMPFLADSISGELQRRGFTVHMSIHPVLRIARSASGKLLGLADDGAGDVTAESFVHMQIDQCLDARLLREIAESLREVLAEARSVVEDWPAMRSKIGEVIAEVSALGACGAKAEDIAETKDFLEWLDDNNFTYLGYRRLDIAVKKDSLQWKIVKGSGLGAMREDDSRVFGGLGEIAVRSPEVRRFLNPQCLTIVAKTDRRARVHRTVPMDAVFVQRFDDGGKVVGEHLFIGLFTSRAYSQSARDVPLLRHKITRIAARAAVDPNGHAGRALLHILDNYPRDELFQIDPDELYAHSQGIVQLQERPRVALFLRRDAFGRFITCLIYVPRDRYDSRMRSALQRHLEAAFGGKMSDQIVRIDDNPLARLFMTITTESGAPRPDREKLETELRELCRTWQDRLREKLVEEYGEARTLDLLRRYGKAFTSQYRNATHPDAAVRDLLAIEKTLAHGKFVADLSPPDDAGVLRLRLFRPDHPLLLSEMLPLIEDMGLKVEYMGGPYEVLPEGGTRTIYVHEFACRMAREATRPFAEAKPLFEDALGRVWAGEAEHDPFNSLVLRAGLPWRDVMVLRAMGRYLRQLRIPYGTYMMANTLLAHPQVARDLSCLFAVRHDPDFRGNRAARSAELAEKINSELSSINALEEDRIIRRYLNLIQSSLRSNFFQRQEDGQPKPYLAIKFNSRAIDYMPLPRPMMEIFVYSPRMEAVHLRGGKVARGGIRWSDRRDDFRNEILGLMKAQMVKNTVIVPVGSKGGFIVRRPPSDPAEQHAEGVACYRLMMRGLLDLTDNRVGGKIVPPPRVVRHDDDDPYLVVAADKGTAKFSDIANGISREYGFWLDDAFASGGSAGYDHKQMGITARGAWEAVKRHFREMGIDTQSQDFTCMGVGDMSGDVFGNGMLLSKHIRLIGAFDHRHIFCDPNPDAARSFAERQRMFNLSGSSWNDYDRKKISAGGGVFSRNEKVLRLSPEIQKAFGIKTDSLPPNDLIIAMLKSKVDLLYFGGIGTYVKASDESNDEAGDRANEAVRIDGREIQARVVAEGANLGMTQRGRVEYAAQGGRVNTDAIDNSAGVDTSDHEVNIKILLQRAVSGGALTLSSRNKLLSGMTDEVAALVLRDNYLQTQALSLSESRAAELLSRHVLAIRAMEKSGLLNRAVEFLPDEVELAERLRLGKGLTRPELAVLMAYAKIWLYDRIVSSDLADDDFLEGDLLGYFPAQLQKKYAADIAKHQLRRELAATVLCNDIVNRFGCYFVFALADSAQKTAVEIVRGCIVARAALDLPTLWEKIEGLDNRVPAAAQTAMLTEINRTASEMVTWFIKNSGLSGKLSEPAIRHNRGSVRLAAWLEKDSANLGDACIAAENSLAQSGVPRQLAKRMAIFPHLTLAPDITLLSERAGCDIECAAKVFFGLRNRLGIDWLKDKMMATTSSDSQWQREAIAALLDDMSVSQRKLASRVLSYGGKSKKFVRQSGPDPLALWLTDNATAMEPYDALLTDVRSAAAPDLAMLTLVSRRLAELAG